MTPCIIGPNKPAANGYVYVWRERRPQLAHRVAWEDRHGPVPTGLVLDHLCRNKPCINTDHLEPVTQAENMRRGAVRDRQRNQTHCKHGHSLEDAYHPPGTTWRDCRTCRRLRKERFNATDNLSQR